MRRRALAAEIKETVAVRTDIMCLKGFRLELKTNVDDEESVLQRRQEEEEATWVPTEELVKPAKYDVAVQFSE